MINMLEYMKNVGSDYDGIKTIIFKSAYMAIIDKLVHFANTSICITAGIIPSSNKAHL